MKFKKFKYTRKSIIISIGALLFGLTIILLSALSCSRSQVQAQVGGEEPEHQQQVTQLPVPEKEKTAVDYYLPYPGILPDHPLYWLKMIRDKIMLTITKDPTEKMHRMLLYADKRIGAAKALVDGGKKELGVTTATKAEKYIEQVVSEYKNLPEDKITPELTTRLSKATAKHMEVLMEMIDKVEDQSKPALQEYLDKTSGFYAMLEEIRLGK